MANENYPIESIGVDVDKYKGISYAAYAVNTTFTFANNSLFYALINPSYYDYYWRIVRMNLAWYDGYVPGVHNIQNGIFSTRIATAIVNGTTDQVFGKTLSYKKGNESKDNKALDFISNKWSKQCNAPEQFKLAMRYAFAGGTSCLKINQAMKDVWLEAVRSDYFYFATDFQGNLQDIVFYIKGYINTNRSDKAEKQKNYFIVEHRYYKDCIVNKSVYHKDPVTNENVEVTIKVKQPHCGVVEYQVHEFTGQMLINNNMPQVGSSVGLKWQNIPQYVRAMILHDYTAVKFNRPQIIPFTDLGCELIRDGRDASVPQAQFGESLLTNIRSYLIEYEFANAYSIRDMFNGQGQLGVPKSLSQGDVSGQTANVFSDTKLNYETFPGDPDKQKPVITQFELRVDEWAHKKDDILKKIATTLGMSPKIIASYLVDGTIQKTATQIQSDDDSVMAYVENKRASFEYSYNKILLDITRFYSYSDIVEIKFGSPSLLNKDEIIKEADFKYQNGYIDLKEALKEMNPEYTESQLDVAYQKAVARQQEIQLTRPTEMNTLGDYGND